MQGLELCRRYYQEIGEPTLTRAFPELMGRMAFGLCGEGSECFGYDDDISRDHDYGPSFTIWMSDEDYEKYGKEVMRAYNYLPTSFMGYSGRTISNQGGGRIGPVRISDFYRRFTGCPQGPSANLEWVRIPEHLLAQAVNGQVFRDDSGEFTGIRERLLGFYPEEVRRKKIAARAITMAQAGQYNYPRSMKREDAGASFQAMGEFLKAAFSMAHLLEKKYMPYYKWSYRSLQRLEIFADSLPIIEHMMKMPMDPANIGQVEELCQLVVKEWNRQGLTGSRESFLEPQGWELYRSIQDPDLSRRGIWEA